MPNRRGHPLVSTPDPHLADGSPWRMEPGRKRSFSAKALVAIGLAAAVAYVLLAFGWADTPVKPYLEQLRQTLFRG